MPLGNEQWFLMTLCCHQPFLFWPCPFGLQPAVCPANDAHDAALSVQTSPVTSVAMSSWLFTAALLSLLCACSVSVAFWCCNSKTFGQTLTSRRVCGFVWFLFHCPLSSATWRTELCLAVRCINALFCLDYWVNRCCNCNKRLHASLYEPQSEWAGKLWWLIYWSMYP